MSVTVAEAKKESWAQNCEGSKMKREDKWIKYEFDNTNHCWYAQKYCTPVMFAHFVCALLSFCARNFPVKYETQETENPGKVSWNEPHKPRVTSFSFVEPHDQFNNMDDNN